MGSERLMVNMYAVGQRWISESEPDLGLGTIVQIDKGRVQILFSASDELRTYASDNAPLKRVQFRAGDCITTHDNRQIIVEQIEEDAGIITYIGDGDEIHESLLSDAISFHTAKDRLLTGQLDEIRAFELRRQTLSLQHYQKESRVRGFVGGRIDLIPHQLYIAHEVSCRYAPRVLLSDEVGLGKTIEACLIIHRMLLSGRASRALIVVPESLVHQWFVEMLRRFNIWLNIFDEERCAAVAPSAPNKNPFLDDQLILSSLEFLAGSQKRAAQAVSAGWDVLVVDEAHHLAWAVEHASKEYLLIEALARKSAGLLLLTATPEQLGVESHFARLRLLDPTRYNNFNAFRDESHEFKRIANIIDRISTDATPEKDDILFLQERLNQSSVEVKKKFDKVRDGSTDEKQAFIEELLDLHGTGRVLFRNTRAGMKGFPKRIPHFAPIDVNQQSQWLEQVRKEFLYDIEQTQHQPSYVFAGDPRLEWLVTFLQSLGKNKALLICRSKEKALALHDALRSRVNISAGIFHEDLTLVQRDRNAAWFAEDDGAQLLICSEIGSEGRNFQFAHNLILFDLPLNPELLEQRIGRLDRIGQKEDIQIHVPYLNESPQEILARWYHEGLNAFAQNLIGTNEVLAGLSRQIHEIALGNENKDKSADQITALLQQTKTAKLSLDKNLQQGRDRLLEMNSFRPAVAQDLIEAIKKEDQDHTLENYMLEVLEHFGVQVEELAPRTYYLNPQGITVEAFPSIPDEGISVTFDRNRALVREEIAFMSWDHPLVTGAMDIMIGAENGNSSFGVYPDEEENAVLLEAIFIVESVSKHKNRIDQFFPATPIRVLVDGASNDITESLPSPLLSEKLVKGDASRLLDNSLVTQQLIPDMLEVAQTSAQVTASSLIEKSNQRLEQKLGHEIDRLKALQAMNGTIRQAEVIGAIQEREALTKAILSARLRLDALRLIWKGFR